MELSLNAGSILDNLPPVLSVVGSVLFLAVGVWLRWRKTHVDERRTESDVHLAQVESLMNQVRMLSEELIQTRVQMNELHTQNLELMGQLREANKRIAELEILLGATPPKTENLFNHRSVVG